MSDRESPRCSCGERVTGYALGLGMRFGIFRCGGTHCKHADTPLMRSLRELSPSAPRYSETRVARLEQLLRDNGLEVPP